MKTTQSSYESLDTDHPIPIAIRFIYAVPRRSPYHIRIRRDRALVDETKAREKAHTRRLPGRHRTERCRAASSTRLICTHSLSVRALACVGSQLDPSASSALPPGARTARACAPYGASHSRVLACDVRCASNDRVIVGSARVPCGCSETLASAGATWAVAPPR